MFFIFEDMYLHSKKTRFGFWGRDSNTNPKQSFHTNEIYQI
jgi:hypothetical protein